MKRVTVIQRHYWKHMSPRQHYEVRTLHNLTDKQLNEKLNEYNESYRTCLWSVLHDFNLSKKADQNEYLQYCIECYYEPYCFDEESRQVGAKMVAALREDFPYFK